MLALAGVLVALAAPPANAPLPHDGPALRAAYARTTAELGVELDRWAGRGPLPRAAALDALYQERIVRYLAARPALARAVPAAASDVAARRDLLQLTAPYPPSTTVRIGPAAAPPALRGWYAEAERRFGVPWNVLAAVNFVESRFGRVRNASTAGAQGPMQFLPATWRAYGLGATSTTRTTRSSAPRTSSARTALRATCAARSAGTTTRGSTSTRCSATRGA